MLCYAVCTCYVWTWPYVRVRCVVRFARTHARTVTDTHTHARTCARTHAHKHTMAFENKQQAATSSCRRLAAHDGDDENDDVLDELHWDLYWETECIVVDKKQENLKISPHFSRRNNHIMDLDPRWRRHSQLGEKNCRHSQNCQAGNILPPQLISPNKRDEHVHLS